MTLAPTRRSADRAALWAALFVLCGGCSATTPAKTAAAPRQSPRTSEAIAGAEGGSEAAKAPSDAAASIDELEVPPRVHLPAATASNPSRGPKDAPVVIRLFSDFQCPFCQAVTPTLADLEREYPGKIRIVWHNLPLPFHEHARLAAAAALEAFAEQGNAGFWRMHDAIFEGADPNRGVLVVYARRIGLDAKRFEAALDRGTHEAAIERDLALARAHDISGTPSLVINDFYVVGAQPIEEFRRVVNLALSESSHLPAGPPPR